MLIQTAFNFSSVIQRWVCRFSGLRLLALRWLLVFLASSPCAASASSYFFRSAAQPRWRCAFSQFVPVAKSKLSVLASGSNISVKPTRLRRAAYFHSLAFRAFACPLHRSCVHPPQSPTRRFCRWCSVALRGCACWVPGHSVLASLQAAGYGHTLLVQSLLGAALSSILLGLTRQSS